MDPVRKLPVAANHAALSLHVKHCAAHTYGLGHLSAVLYCEKPLDRTWIDDPLQDADDPARG
jgi:hypothetical protein